MTFLQQVYDKRKKLADILSDDDYSGIRDIVEQLYPDRAHFIYELLQNAEDTDAKTANFHLDRNSLTFEHDGRPFDEQDIWRITNIGKSAKKEDRDKIGRFGVGFKAVFAYSETPHIYSPTYSFKISDLVLPNPLEPRTDLGNRTRFEFPFNNPKKSAESAYGDIKNGFTELAETTLLFLSHLESISWQADQNTSAVIRRIQHSQNHFEVLKILNGESTASVHFLKFDKAVRELEKQRVAVAFVLDFLPGDQRYDHRRPLAKQVKIIPVPGKVAVYFPAEKEASGLRFHLHAPFVPELSRASIKETSANLPLFEQLAELTASSLHEIRELGLLSGDFLAVLPNPQDAVPQRYKAIQGAVVDRMNTEPLTPTHAKSHAPAQKLLQARASLKDLLTEEDLHFLINQNGPWQWAIGATQKNSDIDRFLAGLAIADWDVDKFIELLEARSFEGIRYTAVAPHYVRGPDGEFIDWLSRKPSSWHQEFYALLFEHVSSLGWRKSQLLEKLKVLRIVRRSDGTYGNSSNSYFPSERVENDDALPRVDRAVYTSGKSKTQQQNARKFLEEINVREVGEAEQVEAILDQRYRQESFKPLTEDLQRFIRLVETDSSKATLFADYFIFELKDGKWGKPGQVFIDEPFQNTSLTSYYEALADSTRFPLSDRYRDGQIDLAKLVKFAEEVGAQTRLDVDVVSCSGNPNWPYLRSVGGDRQRSPIDRDYVISGLDKLLMKPSLGIAKLLWRTMASLAQNTPYLQATFRRNESWGSRQVESQLVHHLRESAWVPQGQTLFVRPRDASRDLLPEGFAFDPGWVWLKAIQFGASVLKKSEEQRQKEDFAKELGFVDSRTLERAQRFAALPTEEQERILADEERKSKTELPEHEPANPERRAERVGTKAASAPDRRTEERTRSVSVGLEQVKQQAAQYLRQQYTNADGEMICQICKTHLPFRLDDGSDYFEAVEFLPELTKRHYQNYLALCPNHGAMFQHANGSSECLENAFVNLTINELPVVLAQKDLTIYFTRTHTADLKEVIKVDRTETDASQSSNVGDQSVPSSYASD